MINMETDMEIDMEIDKETYFTLLEKAEKYDALFPTYQKLLVDNHLKNIHIQDLQHLVEKYQRGAGKLV